MNQEIPQPQKKGLSKGCTIALIIGGILIVILAAVIILVMTKGEMWAYKMAANTEKSLLMTNPVNGIDTSAVNTLTDAFVDKINTDKPESEQMMPFALFVRENATDMKIDSTEAVAFVDAMMKCFPELADLYNPAVTLDSTMMPDTGMTVDEE